MTLDLSLFYIWWRWFQVTDEEVNGSYEAKGAPVAPIAFVRPVPPEIRRHLVVCRRAIRPRRFLRSIL